jgi:hypothetical protein
LLSEKMSRFVRLLKFGGIIAGVVVVGILLGWLGSGGLRSGSRAPAAVSPLATSAKPGAAGASAAANSSALPARGPAEIPLSVSEATAGANLITDWEDKIDEILTSEIPEADKAKKMLEMFPRLPEDGQVEVAQHLSNLVSDQDYPSLERLLTNSALPESVLEVLLGDVLNRPNSLKLPALLEVARDSQNPKAGEAKDILQLFLEEDYGTDWNTWQAKVDQWLKENPD